MIFAAILAGGIGSRMNLSDMPKQFLPLKDKPIIIHTLEKFLMCDKFDFFFVGVHPDWMLYMDDLIKKYCPQYRNKICTVPGGKDRNSTLSNVIENLEEKFGESDDHIIVTHDSVRPFVTMRMIDENIEAAKKYKVHGTGITLSHEQYTEFQKRIKDQGLEDYLTVELMDYRDLPKHNYQFDRVVSVGMLEHVGRDNYQLFLDCVEKVLKPGGLFLLHFISALKEHPGDPWIKKYIFPGGTVPSLREILNHMAEDNFHTLDIENLRLHYNKTLLHWEKNFRENIEKEKTMFDESFLRMWELYLSACAATFHNGIIDLHQILMTKGINNDLPMTRWY